MVTVSSEKSLAKPEKLQFPLVLDNNQIVASVVDIGGAAIDVLRHGSETDVTMSLQSLARSVKKVLEMGSAELPIDALRNALLPLAALTTAVAIRDDIVQFDSESFDSYVESIASRFADG